MPVTLAEVGDLAEQLPAWEQLQLVSRLAGRLSQTSSFDRAGQDTMGLDFLRQCEQNPVWPVVPTDSMQTLRDVREERMGGL